MFGQLRICHRMSSCCIWKRGKDQSLDRSSIYQTCFCMISGLLKERRGRCRHHMCRKKSIMCICQPHIRYMPFQSCQRSILRHIQGRSICFHQRCTQMGSLYSDRREEYRQICQMWAWKVQSIWYIGFLTRQDRLVRFGSFHNWELLQSMPDNTQAPLFLQISRGNRTYSLRTSTILHSQYLHSKK